MNSGCFIFETPAVRLIEQKLFFSDSMIVSELMHNLNGNSAVNHRSENRGIHESGIVQVLFILHVIENIVYTGVEFKLSDLF